MWCIYEIYFCKRRNCTCQQNGDYHSLFIEDTTSATAGKDRIIELQRQNPRATYIVQWVYGSQIANAC